MAFTVIDDSEAFFQCKLYTGNGSADHAITLDGDTDMSPNIVWIKNRDQGDSHCLFDTVRGATQLSHINSQGDEVTDADTLDSFTSDGFQVDADVKVNTNAEKYVAWCWKESATAGLDIVGYTGNATARTIAHNLGVVPKTVWVGSRADDGWRPSIENITGTDQGSLKFFNNGTEGTGYFPSTAPDASNFSLSSHGSVNETGDGYVAYVFAPIQGFSKFSTFVGNGSNDGPFLYCGFKPAWFMSKRIDSAASWNIWNNKSNPFNVADALQYADGTDAEASAATYSIDFLSNGIKMRGYRADTNTNGATHVWMAFAEAPLVNSNGVPNNAR